MKIWTNIMMAALLAAAAGCGAHQKSEAPKKDEESAAKPELPAGQPRLLVARVPVNAQGEEMLSEVEFAQSQTDAASIKDKSEAPALFEAGTKTKVLDELDRDSSSQQWWGYRNYWAWNTPWYGGGAYWGRYPYMYYGGYGYPYYPYGGYGYGYPYGWGGYNYYMYCY